MRLIDYAPNVISALAANGPTAQTELTELVFGSSGRGNAGLVNSLFPLCVRRGWVTMTQTGRKKMFAVTDAGRAAVGAGDPHTNWNFETHTFNEA